MTSNYISFQYLGKFYFLEYFYILLKSVEKYTIKNEAFDLFKQLKDEYKLGESKYKKIADQSESLSRFQLERYRYTFEQVIEESKHYGLIAYDNSRIYSTDSGKKLVEIFEAGSIQDFYEHLFRIMEVKTGMYKNIVQFLYKANKHKEGLLVFPAYSPRQLGFAKNEIKSNRDYENYLESLKTKLEEDISQYVGQSHDLSIPLQKLKEKLQESELLTRNNSDSFLSLFYNKITKRVRDYWINHLIKEIYNLPTSYSTFEIWTYRAKQIGILNATDFYPNFCGRVVYPISVLVNNTTSSDFHPIYEYPNKEKLYLHIPSGEGAEEKFVDHLVRDYFLLKNQSNLYFVRLSALRELVCYNMKISETVFETFLNSIYKKNLSGTLKVKISLEVDKLASDSKSMYLKRTPVLVDNQHRNIIAIELRKEHGKNE